MADSSAGSSTPASIPSISPEQYAILLQMAHALHARCPSWTLNPKALAHEALLKVYASPTPPPSDGRHFIALVAVVMRQVLVDAARKKMQVKHGFGLKFVPLTERAARTTLRPIDFLNLIQALEKLARMNERHALVFELTAFYGYTAEEAASRLTISTKTVQRDMRAAHAWLASQVSGGEER